MIERDKPPDRSDWMRKIHPSVKITLIAGLIVIIASLTVYNHFVLGREQVFTHLYYFPVVMACLWWRRGGLVVPIFLGVMLLGAHLVSDIGIPIIDDFIRSIMFMVVGIMVVILSEQQHREQQRALEEKRRRIRKTLEHAGYAQNIAHELRNPLQVVIGCLDGLEVESLPAKQKHLIDILDEKVMEMRTRITELTKREEHEESVDSGGRSGR